MSEELKFNIDDIKFTEEDDGILVEVDETTDTYKVLVALGKQINADSSDDEAFEAGINKLIEEFNSDDTI
jgi:hypothetical protein